MASGRLLVVVALGVLATRTLIGEFREVSRGVWSVFVCGAAAAAVAACKGDL